MNLKGYRASKDLSMEDVSKELNISRTTYLKKEKSGKFWLDEAFAMSKLLDISLEEVYDAIHS